MILLSGICLNKLLLYNGFAISNPKIVLRTVASIPNNESKNPAEKQRYLNHSKKMLICYANVV